MRLLIFKTPEGRTVSFNPDHIVIVQDAFDQRGKQIIGASSIIAGGMMTIVSGGVDSVINYIQSYPSHALPFDFNSLSRHTE